MLMWHAVSHRLEGDDVMLTGGHTHRAGVPSAKAVLHSSALVRARNSA